MCRIQSRSNRWLVTALPKGPARWWRCSDQSMQYRMDGWMMSFDFDEIEAEVTQLSPARVGDRVGDVLAWGS